MPLPEPLELHIQTVWSSVRLVLLQRVICEVLPDTRVDFWRVTQGASVDYGLIEWCKIFGSRADDTHWTNLVPKDRHDAFRDGLHKAVGMTADEWDAYHTKMKEYRDTLAAHIDFNGKSTHYPDFGPALAAAFYYYATFLYPEWSAKHPDTRYPADMRAFAADYHKQLFEVASAAAQATNQFEPGK